MGVFATRSPFRPNPIGLSSVRLLGIERHPELGCILQVAGADLMDGTPIYDIKPYIAPDLHPDAVGGFTAGLSERTLEVDFPPALLEPIPEEDRAALLGVLARDPRPSYQNDPDRVYGLSFAGWNVKPSRPGGCSHRPGDRALLTAQNRKKEKGVFMAYSLYQLLWFFLLYSFLGWCAGVAAAALRRACFHQHRLPQPAAVSYLRRSGGVFSIFLPELSENLFFLFLGGTVLSAFLTFVTGFLLERIFHRKWWDFTRHRFQFEGYISVPLLALWGALAVLCVPLGDPLLARLLDLMPRSVGRPILLAVYLLIALDFLLSLVSVLQLRFRLKRLAGLEKDFRNISSNFGNAITGRIQRRVMHAYPNLETQDIYRDPAGRRGPSQSLCPGLLFS